jgi:hypothetical protein
MYFATEEMPKIWTIAHKLLKADTQDDYDEWVELLGVQEYTVEMIGTNVSADLVKVNYYQNPPDNSIIEYQPIVSDELAINTEFTVGSTAQSLLASFDGYEFEYWFTKKENGEKDIIYLPNQLHTLSTANVNEETKTVNFYAKWKAVGTGLPLYLNYGIGDTFYDEKNDPISVLRYHSGETIGEVISRANKQYISASGLIPLTSLPLSPSPTVKYGQSAYSPYENKGWYTTSIIGVDANGNAVAPLSNSSVLTAERAMTIYQIFVPKKYDLTYVSNGGTEFGTIQVEYNGVVPMLKPYKSPDAHFGGWYTDAELKNAFSGAMPPTNLILYAKWVEEK